MLTTLLQIWENFVRATHHFLSDAEINQIKTYVPQALNHVKHLVIAENNDQNAIAFMRIENNRLEMLFLSPRERGKGIGKQLIRYGIEHYDLQEVTVNEQNPQAVGFYGHLDFEICKRENSYPLLYMKYTGI